MTIEQGALFKAVGSFRKKNSDIESVLSYGGSRLSADDHMLRNLFLSVFRHHHPELAPKIDRIYALSEGWCSTESDADFKRLTETLEDLQPEELILVRFTHYGSCTNPVGPGECSPFLRLITLYVCLSLL